MQWLNEPASWQRAGDLLKVNVDPSTDFWRETGYGYIHDNGHVYGEVIAGDLDVSVRVRASFTSHYDQAGVMLRVDERTWLKTGLEFFEGRTRLSTVLTLGQSSWTVADLPDGADEITLRASRRGDAVEVRYTVDGGSSELAALVFLPPGREVLAGVMCAAPEGPGFSVNFQDLRIAGRSWNGQAAAPDAAGQEWDSAAGQEWRADGADSEWERQPEAAGGAGWPAPEAGSDGPGGWTGEPAGGWNLEERPADPWEPGPGQAARPWDDELEAARTAPSWEPEAEPDPARASAPSREPEPEPAPEPAGGPPWDPAPRPAGGPPWVPEPPPKPARSARLPEPEPAAAWDEPLADDPVADWERLSAAGAGDGAASGDGGGWRDLLRPAAASATQEEPADATQPRLGMTRLEGPDSQDPVATSLDLPALALAGDAAAPAPAAAASPAAALPRRKSDARNGAKSRGRAKAAAPITPDPADAADEWISLLTADPAEDDAV